MAAGEISVRLMTEAEAPLAAEVLASSVRTLWRGHLSEAVIEGVVRGNGAAEILKRGEREEDYLAWLDGRAAGYLGLKRNEIGLLFIHADAVGRGVGRTLCRFTDDCLRRRGHKTAVVYASPTSLGFYEKQGFRRTGQNVSFEVGLGAFIPAVFMEKDLWPKPEEVRGLKVRPTLETERLILRPFAPEDAPDVQRLAGEREIADTTLNIPHPYEDGVAERWIATHQERFEKGELVNFAVTRREDGALLGAVGLHVTPAHARAELGYWIGRPFWGRGYATEAARAVLRYGFDVLNLHRCDARHFARNPASGRVMQKLGMTREGVLRQYVRKWDRYEDCVFYGILREEFPAPR